MTWTADLDLGIDEIDRQHRQIVDYINHLHDAREAGDRAGIGAVIDELVDYTMSHFAFEEELLDAAGYAFSRPHKRVHEVFTRRVDEYRRRYNAGEDIAAELHALLMRWLIGHIKHDDAAYVDAVNAHTGADAARHMGWVSRTLSRVFPGLAARAA